MNEGLILAIDCGTQSVRALLFDKLGNLIGKEQEHFEPYFSQAPGWAEQNPEIFWESTCRVCKVLKEKMPENWDRIIGLTVTTQRDTVVNMDKDGRVLRPAIIWLDQRMAECREPLAFHDNLIFSTIGMKRAIDITRRKSKANWIKENQPEIWDKTYKYMLLSGYFIYKLTGKFADSSACQIGHIPFNYKKREWPKSKGDYRWSVFGVEADKLCDIYEPGSVIGYISKEVSEETGIPENTPVIASGSDKGCETLGAGCLDLNTASLSFGTTATVQTCSDHYFEPIQFLPSYPASMPGYFNPEVQIFRGYWMISWFKKEFSTREMAEAKSKNISPEVLLNETLNDVPPGSQGLILQPYWGPGLKAPSAKGSIIGFGDVHTRAHIYRAIVEGINYALIDGTEKIEKKSGIRINKIMVSGGGSQSDAICQITSDMFNLPVYKGETYEASGLGAAINGFVGLGIYESYEMAVAKMVRCSKVFKPDAKNAEIYRKLYNRVYKKIYGKLSGLYEEIKDIIGYPDF